VVGLDTCAKWGASDRSRNYEFHRGDCSDESFLRPLLKGASGVIQAAATLFGVIGFHRRAADILSNDLAAHRTALRLSVDAGVQRVVYMSSSMVYERVATEPYEEDDVENAPIPATDYGLSKLVGERLSKAYFRQYGLSYTIWRPFNVVDPEEEGSDDPGVSHVFADLVHRIVGRQQNPLELLGDGYQVRSFVYIGEVARAIARFSFAPSTANEVFNLGRDECVTVRELATIIHQLACERHLLGNPGPLQFRARPVPDTDVKRRVGCFAKASRLLGWDSRVTLRESLRDCIESYCRRNSVAGARYGAH
jgi:nucleoside-diphosphate-sugar epimerase